jgi:hypothetical protein
MPRCTLSMTLVCVCACAGAQTAADEESPTWLFHHDATGVSFDLPQAWQITRPGSALVFSGPAESPAYYTTITMQALLDTEQPLDEVLTAAYGDLADLPQFAWHFREPAVTACRPGLRYGLQAEVHESLRFKHGVLFDASGTVVDLSYAATPELFFDGLPVFEHALATLAVVDTTP